MAQEAPKPSHWAILIGVGSTTPKASQDGAVPTTETPLDGAIQDIIVINQYLRGTIHAVKIMVLASTQSSDASTASTIEAQLPTRDNVCASFTRVLQLAEPGNSVYIHFSGHGTVRNLDGAVALVLVHPSGLMAQYLYGSVLRSAIHRMVEKGLSVTLVLDCCFSGKVLRNDQVNGHIRYVKFDPAIDEESAYDDPFILNSSDNIRGAKIQLSRLLAPQGYTIITACGSEEVALELTFEAGARRGALSYFLIDSLTDLRKTGAYVSHLTLYQHLRSRFHSRYPHQTPMLYGNNGFSFFRDLTANSSLPIVSVHRNYDNLCLILNAGQAHGVHQDDEYIICPFDTSDDLNAIRNRQTIKAKVISVDCFTSKLVTIDPEDLERIAKGTAWKAILITSCSNEKTPIRLLPSVPRQDELLETTKANSYLSLLGSIENNETQAPMYEVDFIEREYKVQNPTSKPVFNLPSIPFSQDGNHNALLSILEHLAKFKYFESIENRMPSQVFERSYKIHCNREPGEDGYYRVQDQKDLILTFDNLTDSPMYIAVFMFTELWEVQNLTAECGDHCCMEMKMGQNKLELEMSVPPELQAKGQRQTEDIVKLIITSQSSVFPAMVLPRLDVAGIRGGPDQLAKLCQGLSGISQRRGDKQYYWATRNYLIRTFID